MIIGKKDKEKISLLEEENKRLKEENYKTKNSVLRDMLKSDIMQVMKAFINKLGDKEITLNEKEIEEAKRYDLYVQDDFLHTAKRYNLIDKYKNMNNI